MIIFYNKFSGHIVGTLEGRVHSKAHLNMWIGGKEDVERLWVEWVKAREDSDWHPDHVQDELFRMLDRDPSLIYHYKVNVETKTLEPIENA